MAKKELTEEQIKEKEKKKADKEREAQEKLVKFKSEKHFDKISDELLIRFIYKAESYKDLTIDDAIELLLKKFANGDFAFKPKKGWE